MRNSEQVKLSINCELDAPFQLLLETYPGTIALYRDERKNEVDYTFEDAGVFSNFLTWACDNSDLLPGDDASEELIDSLEFWQEQFGSTAVDVNPRFDETGRARAFQDRRYRFAEKLRGERPVETRDSPHTRQRTRETIISMLNDLAARNLRAGIVENPRVYVCAQLMEVSEDLIELAARTYVDAYGLINLSQEKRQLLADWGREWTKTGGCATAYANPGYGVADNPNEPNLHAHKMAQEYVKSVGLPPLQPTPYVKIDPEVSKRIADAFEAAENTPDAEDVILAYDQFVLELDEQLKFVPVEIVSASQFGEYPYKTSKELVADVLNNNRMVVFDGGDDHAILSREENFKFRAVHDYFGHVATGFEFGPRGEENAWIEHSKMFTPLARQALTTEARGQNSWVNFGPHSGAAAGERPYAEQKAAILPPWVQTHEVLEEAYAEYPDFYLGQARELVETMRSLGSSVGHNPDDVDYTTVDPFTGTAYKPDPLASPLFDIGEKAKAKVEPALTVKQFKKIRDEIYGQVMDYFAAGEDGKDWYENTPKRIAEFFQNNSERTDLFIGFLAATSPMRNIKQNVKLALKALKQYDAGAWLPPEYEKISEAEYDAAKKNNLRMAESGADHGFDEVRATQKTIKKKKVMQYVRVHCPPRPYAENNKTGFDYHDGKVIHKLAKKFGGIPRSPEDRAREYCEPRKRNNYQQVCCFRLGMPAHEPNAARVARREELSGPKVTAFYDNLTKPAHSDNSVTVDTWMLRAFGFRKMNADETKESNAPTDAERLAITAAITELAEIGGLKPRQFQAAVWVGVKRLHGDTVRDTDEPFEVVLQREAEALAQQDVFEFEEDESAEIEAMREERRPIAENAGAIKASGTRDPDTAIWNQHYGAWIAPDGKIYWVPHEGHAKIAIKILSQKYGVELDIYEEYAEAYDRLYDEGYVRIYSNRIEDGKFEAGYFGIELKNFEKSKAVLKAALNSLVRQKPELRMHVTEVKGTKFDFANRETFDEVAMDLFREAGGGWSEGVKKYHEWSSVGPMGSMRQRNPMPQSPSYEDWSAHYGAWLSPEGELIWVPDEGHVDAGRKILLENFDIELDEEKVSPVYDAMFKHGYVRFITGDILRVDNEIGIDLASFEASKEVIEAALRKLRKDNHTVEVLITEFPQSDDSEYKSWHKPLGALFQVKGGWSEGVQKYHEWSSVGPMGSMRQGNNPPDLDSSLDTTRNQPSVEDFFDHYGAWISPEGLVIWVTDKYGHATTALNILGSYNVAGLNRDDHFSLIYREMFNRGFVRLLSGHELQAFNTLALDAENLATSKPMLRTVLENLVNDLPAIKVVLGNYPCRMDSDKISDPEPGTLGEWFGMTRGEVHSKTEAHLKQGHSSWDDPGNF